MLLALSAIRRANETVTGTASIPLTAARSKIGRGADCDIVLQDATRHISRHHATVTRQGEAYVLTVESTVNPVIVNGNTLAGGQSATLSAGDEIAIAEHVFKVIAAEQAAGEQSNSAPDWFGTSANSADAQRSEIDALFAVPAQKAGPASPGRSAIDNLIGADRNRASHDPLLGILGGGQQHGSDSRDFPSAATDRDTPLLQMIGDRKDVVAALPGLGQGTSRVMSIDSMLGSTGSSSADPLGLTVPIERNTAGYGGGRGGSLELDHVHDINLPFAPPRIGHAPNVTRQAAPVIKEDPLASLFAAQPSAPRQVAAPLTARAPDTNPIDFFSDVPDAPNAFADAATGGLPTDAQSANVAPAADAQCAMQPGAAGVMALAAQEFLQGAGVTDVKLSDAEAQQFLRECGAVCRSAIEGLMALLLARATVKDQLRVADRTMVSAVENNPLKLIENVHEAVRFVFDKHSRSDAFLPPDKAVADACVDLQAHEIALVAGMRSALIGAVKRFEPGIIEKKLGAAGGSSLLGNKKAKLWEAFLAYYDTTTRDAEDNFDKVFGPDFLRAYQEQIKRLKH